jgi:hypothetical protein
MTNFQKLFWLRALVFIFLAIQAAVPMVVFSQEAKVDPWDDGSAVEYRKPPVEAIDGFKSNPDYNYDGSQETMSLFQRLLYRLLLWLIEGASGKAWLAYLFGSVVIIGILFLILRLLNVPFSGLFTFARGSSVAGLDLVHPAEELSRDEMEKMFQLYRTNGAYREAVRILYLMYLKRLHQNGEIQLRMNKTNKDYAREIRDDRARNGFKKLSRLYEFVWFGQFGILAQEFYQIEKEFDLARITEPVKINVHG